jgi:hypothetical protein
MEENVFQIRVFEGLSAYLSEGRYQSFGEIYWSPLYGLSWKSEAAKYSAS